MISNTNDKSGQSKTLAQLYEVFLYKKKDIIAIQEKLSINGNINHKNLDVDGNPILAVERYNNLANQSNKASTDLSLLKLYNLLYI
ncbi:8829_t:CDS:2 [Entrophospora sp. SA101]|nr:33_t:CDS:2 [Entrophospora sp. SA101]CAJ0881178.1 8829_t:CDS:2 [Entrophospora sp. SA101]